MNRDPRDRLVLGEDRVHPFRSLLLVIGQHDRAEGISKLMDSMQFVPSGRSGKVSPHVFVAIQERLQRGQIVDLILSAVGALIGVDQRHSKVNRLVGVMCKIHLTYYFQIGIVMSISQYAAYVNKEGSMDSYTQFASEMHRYRSDQLVQAVERTRLINSLPKKSRSLKLGAYVLTLNKPTSEIPQPAS